MKFLKKAVLPLGFKASGLHCGIKRSAKPDLALFFSLFPAKAACLFTSNKIQAAPLKVCRAHLKKSHFFKAIIANSGNANCFTGNAGVMDAKAMARFTAEVLNLNEQEVLVASTGIIGKRMDISKIKKAMLKLAGGLSSCGIDKAKKAIMTTDIFSKEFTASFKVGSSKVTISGVAKGAGMICPNMATMLAFLFTDANISQTAMSSALKSATEDSFNSITVDGCMSTNDTVFLLANSAAKNKLISGGRELQLFSKGLKVVCLELAKMMVRDGEGATKFIRIEVSKARTKEQARKAALSIANSNLFKTAVYGENPNFGRILAAIGSSGVDIDEKRIKVNLGPLQGKDINVKVNLNLGKESSVVYTSDLTPEYIKINAEYN
jgi:glutamate N-acetyltransferase / amino-acid N-acetyltransferase